MVNIYVKRYKKMIENGEMTASEAIKDAKINVPLRWRDEVVKQLENLE